MCRNLSNPNLGITHESYTLSVPILAPHPSVLGLTNAVLHKNVRTNQEYLASYPSQNQIGLRQSGLTTWATTERAYVSESIGPAR